jgi:hypothetical protein
MTDDEHIEIENIVNFIDDYLKDRLITSYDINFEIDENIHFYEHFINIIIYGIEKRIVISFEIQDLKGDLEKQICRELGYVFSYQLKIIKEQIKNGYFNKK